MLNYPTGVHWQSAKGKALSSVHFLSAWCTFLKLHQAKPLVGILSLGNCSTMLKYFHWNYRIYLTSHQVFMQVIPNPGLAVCHSKFNNQETGAGGRKIGLFNNWQHGKVVDLYHKDHLSRWAWAVVFVRSSKEEKRRKELAGGT